MPFPPDLLNDSEVIVLDLRPHWIKLFSAVLFFIDGSGASMTKRAVAPLTLDMQRVLTAPLGGGIRFERRVGDRALDAANTTLVTLTVTNDRRLSRSS